MTSILVKDRCWSVPIVAAFCAFVISFTYSSSGLMYVLFMEEFHISHEQAAWPQSTNIVLGNSIGIVGPSLLNYLAEDYGCKGSLLLAGGIAANAIPFVMLLNNPQPFDLPACCRCRKVRDSAIPDQAAASLQTVKAASLALMPALNTISRRERAGEEPHSLGSLKQPSMMEVSDTDTVSERNQLPSDTAVKKK
ncbi:hypothetical protein HPB52_005747 [Rhipicephalus sanguineus]|uniref:Monocarboxylate transporter n=1 Tax=Rhipicephalus sanguineus TaxID=34632 RepID=A0A9D4PUL1_RHISA|nr:hypothetical protein HPB52_005747 [Rhipicephalus sanguineus]